MRNDDMSPTNDSNRPFNGLLRDAETILWSGQPRQGFVFQWRDPLNMILGVIVLTLAIHFEYSAFATQKAPLIAKILPLAFIYIAYQVLIGRFFFDRTDRAKTFYAVTNFRVIIVSEHGKMKTWSVGLGELPKMDLTERSNGEGTINFQVGTFYDNMFFAYNRLLVAGRWPTLSSRTGPSFEMIPNVRDVSNIISKAAAATK